MKYKLKTYQSISKIHYHTQPNENIRQLALQARESIFGENSELDKITEELPTYGQVDHHRNEFMRALNDIANLD